MQTKIPKIVFSNLMRKSSHFYEFGIVDKTHRRFSLAQFSSEADRLLRGAGRIREAADVGSERNFRDRSPSPRSPDRPLRNQRGDQDFVGGRPDFRRSRPLRKERPDDGSNQNFNGGRQDFRGLRENKEEMSDGSLGNSDAEKEEDGFGNDMLKNLNFGEVTAPKRGEGTGKAVAGADPEAPPEDADEIFKKMKETGLIPNAVEMLDGLCKDGLVQEAMKLFGLMREKGTIPEVVIYTAVVDGFCKAAKFDDAKRIFRKMQQNGIVPNAFSYGVVIQGMCSGKKLEDAVEFCLEMLDAGHPPNPATLTALVNGFCKDKGVEEAEGFLRSLMEKGIAIDQRAIREYLDKKKGACSPLVWEVMFGKKKPDKAF